MPCGSFRWNFTRFRLVLLMGLLAMQGLLAAVPANAQEEGFMVTNETAATYQKVPEIENQLYGHAYPSQAISQRISRIERTLFGSVQRGPSEIRMQKIATRMNEQKSKVSQAEQEPIIEYLEEKLFQRSYPGKPLPERIQQLETQVFGRSFDNYPIQVRVKKLTYAMPVMAKGIRLTSNNGDMVIASTNRVSERVSRGMAPKTDASRDMIELDAAGSPARKMPSGAPLSSGDYFQAVHHNTDGTLVRWAELPIRVYIKPAEALETSITLQALKAWQDSFSVAATSSGMQADVIVSWDKRDWDMNPEGLMARPVTHMDDHKNIRTVIFINMYPMKNQPTQNQLHVVAHELGHAFGLWAHSDDPGDIMYPVFKLETADYPTRWSWRSAGNMTRIQPPGIAEGFAPSQRDVNTLLKVYDQPATDLSTYSPY